MRINLLRGPFAEAVVLAVLVILAGGCGSGESPQANKQGPAQYACQDEPVVVMATSVDRELLYLCDDGHRKITWRFDKHNVSGVSIEFKPDYPFNGPPKTIVSKPEDDYVDSPPISKLSGLKLYKYNITITTASGSHELDPHILSGGSY